jgi:hypothetical protein
MSVTEIVSAYGAAWGEPDEAARRKLLETAWADDGVYCDPTGKAEGREALVAHIGGMRSAFPDHRLDILSGVDEHNGYLRFTWALVGPEQSVVLEGVDFGTVGADGRLARIVGFFGPVPAP